MSRTLCGVKQLKTCSDVDVALPYDTAELGRDQPNNLYQCYFAQRPSLDKNIWSLFDPNLSE